MEYTGLMLLWRFPDSLTSYITSCYSKYTSWIFHRRGSKCSINEQNDDYSALIAKLFLGFYFIIVELINFKLEDWSSDTDEYMFSHQLHNAAFLTLRDEQWQAERRVAGGWQRYLNSWISKNIFRRATCQALVLNNGWQSFLHYIKCANASAVVCSTHPLLLKKISLLQHENSR